MSQNNSKKNILGTDSDTNSDDFFIQNKKGNSVDEEDIDMTIITEETIEINFFEDEEDVDIEEIVEDEDDDEDVFFIKKGKKKSHENEEENEEDEIDDFDSYFFEAE